MFKVSNVSNRTCHMMANYNNIVSHIDGVSIYLHQNNAFYEVVNDSTANNVPSFKNKIFLVRSLPPFIIQKDFVGYTVAATVLEKKKKLNNRKILLFR